MVFLRVLFVLLLEYFQSLITDIITHEIKILTSKSSLSSDLLYRNI